MCTYLLDILCVVLYLGALVSVYIHALVYVQGFNIHRELVKKHTLYRSHMFYLASTARVHNVIISNCVYFEKELVG